MHDMSPDIEQKNKIEIEFWRDHPTEGPALDVLSLENLTNKAAEARIFLDCLRRHPEAATEGKVVELGGGQGWASCVFKRLNPRAHVTTTDISEHAVVSSAKWARIYEVTIDNAYACKSCETQEADASVDRVFTFAAAHHFLEHRKTLKEIARILKPGGKAIYFYEPVTSRALYKFAYDRVNRKRPEVPEDVLIVSQLSALAAEAGLIMQCDYFPSVTYRGPKETLYFSVMRQLSFLQSMLPCTANIVFRKPARQV